MMKISLCSQALDHIKIQIAKLEDAISTCVSSSEGAIRSTAVVVDAEDFFVTFEKHLVSSLTIVKLDCVSSMVLNICQLLRGT